MFILFYVIGFNYYMKILNRYTISLDLIKGFGFAITYDQREWIILNTLDHRIQILIGFMIIKITWQY